MPCAFYSTLFMSCCIHLIHTTSFNTNWVKGRIFFNHAKFIDNLLAAHLYHALTWYQLVQFWVWACRLTVQRASVLRHFVEITKCLNNFHTSVMLQY
jgi:hypothetical protein